MENYFASNLKKLRQNKRLSQNKLGELVGYNQTTIARWEDKKMSPSVENVLRLCEVFDVDIATFLGRDIVIENGVIVNQHYGIKKIPVYDIDFIKRPVDYEEIAEERIGDQTWIGLKAGEDIEGLCKAGDIIVVIKQDTFNEDDTVVYLNEERAVLEKTDNVLGVIKEVRRRIA